MSSTAEDPYDPQNLKREGKKAGEGTTVYNILHSDYKQTERMCSFFSE